MFAEVWNCESGDRIKGCDGTRPRRQLLAGVYGWSITKVAAFSICRQLPQLAFRALNLPCPAIDKVPAQGIQQQETEFVSNLNCGLSAMI